MLIYLQTTVLKSSQALHEILIYDTKEIMSNEICTVANK